MEAVQNEAFELSRLLSLLCGPLKEALHVRKFSSDNDVKDGIHKLVHRYQKCVDFQGDYVEK